LTNKIGEKREKTDSVKCLIKLEVRGKKSMQIRKPFGIENKNDNFCLHQINAIERIENL
jgi:hypothetical protein